MPNLDELQKKIDILSSEIERQKTDIGEIRQENTKIYSNILKIKVQIMKKTSKDKKIAIKQTLSILGAIALFVVANLFIYNYIIALL